MAIPTHQELFLPFLRLLEDGREHALRECRERLADLFGLSAAERTAMLPSGRQRILANRVGWARTYLKKAGLVSIPRPGFVRLTDRGRKVLAENPEALDNRYLRRFPEFREFLGLHRRGRLGKGRAKDGPTPDPESVDPVERMESAYQEYEDHLAEELSGRLQEISPTAFERVVIDLLVAMGYGGDFAEAARVLGGSGDGGVDGEIAEDPLGLDVLYVQAKQWTNPVGRPEVQRFVGAIHGRRSKKGVFITTSSFSREARDYARGIESKIVLIDGERLARLMIRHGVGVQVRTTFAVRVVDPDYFDGIS